ncbi:unnamed protein product [Spodoptera exigua]|nr:unnamed protein product [Spodoptera exigua]
MSSIQFNFPPESYSAVYTADGTTNANNVEHSSEGICTWRGKNFRPWRPSEFVALGHRPITPPPPPNGALAGRKSADGLPDGKQSAPPMDARKDREVTSASPTFWGLRIKRFLVVAKCNLTDSCDGSASPPTTVRTPPSSLFSCFHCAEANEQTDHLMVNDRRRPWTPATPEESQVRCRPFKKEYARFLKVGKRADGLPDGKQSAPPMDARNNRGITSAWPIYTRLYGDKGFGDLEIGGGKGLGLG